MGAKEIELTPILPGKGPSGLQPRVVRVKFLGQRPSSPHPAVLGAVPLPPTVAPSVLPGNPVSSEGPAPPTGVSPQGVSAGLPGPYVTIVKLFSLSVPQFITSETG